ncbi:MAG: DUF4235 domain-containing protein [Microlunatus sp.]|nr:DUF4235 domain-containing protein [Microlunatus sp.]MDN5770825.1 DUF4235 domain-containing protein [Microlunatus sp.]MDN5803826.1 DUF4235 domain-containing protein [Microlunatus sp.]
MANMAKLAYRPLGLAASLGAAAMAGRVVGVIWRKVANEDEIPDALNAEYSMGKVLAAALIQAGVFAIVQSLVDRGGAKLFQRLTGTWPGD